ncbi:TPA: DotI/IcmL/TraM family protein [Aeromonas veronii]|nr:DotI/IcmL/TraM family protein [Aeromonas veronii]
MNKTVLYGQAIEANEKNKLNKRLLLIVLGLVACLVFKFNALSVLRSAGTQMPDRNVFTEDLRAIQIYSLDDPIHSDEDYKSFFVDCTFKSLSIDPTSYSPTLMRFQKSCMTRNGFAAYLNQLAGKSGILNDVKSGVLWNVKAVNNAHLVKSGLTANNVFYQTWQADVVVQKTNMLTPINYIDDIKSTNYSLKAVLVRGSNVDFKNGIAIERIVFE